LIVAIDQRLTALARQAGTPGHMVDLISNGYSPPQSALAQEICGMPTRGKY